VNSAAGELGQTLGRRSALDRVGRRVSVFLLSLALLTGEALLANSAHSQEVRAELSGAVENGHARLVFTFERETKAEVLVSNNILIVSFPKPVTLETEGVRERLPGYVQAVRRDPDGTALRMSLSRKVTANVMEAGDKLFVDLLPEGWRGLPPGLPQSVIDDLAKRARDAEKNALTKRAEPVATPVVSTVRLQVSTAPTFSRFAFELPNPIPIAVERDGQEVRLHFNAPVRIDLGSTRAQLPKGVVGLDVAFEDGRSTVKLVLAPNADARDFREDRSLFVDVSPGPIGQSAPVIRDLANDADQQAERDRVRLQAEAKPAQAEQSAPDTRLSMADASGPDAPAPLDFASRQDVAGGGPIIPVIGRHDGRFSIDFVFTDPVAAAVFTRDDNIWLVFDTLRAIDVSTLIEEPTRSVHEARYLRSDLGAAVRIKPSMSRLPSVERNGNIWRLTLSESVSNPSRPLPVRRASAPDARGAISVPLEMPGQVHRLQDPSIGDTLFVVTAEPPARGILREQNFVEFTALASTHGLAFAPLADDLAVTLTADGALLRRPDGLAVTSVATQAPPPKEAVVETRKKTILDPENWRGEQALAYAPREGVLMEAVAASPAGSRINARLMLARFYLAHGFAAEAIGTLEAGVREDNQLLTRPLYFLLRSWAELGMGRPGEALKLLRNNKVADIPEAASLRAIALSELGMWTLARDAIRASADAFDDLPVEMQRRVMFSAARASIEVRDLNDATRYLHELELAKLPDADKPELALLSARVAEGVGRFDRARVLYDSIAEMDDGAASAEALFRSVQMRHARGDLARTKAIERLETLAVMWRGDSIELETIRFLGRLYVGESRYRDAFQLLDAALIVDPEADITHEFHGEMASVFEDLFLTGKADALPSIEALAIYYDFSRLTPIGRRGDELIRRLADRLVSVDLLEQAAELLDHQVHYRLTGAAKAQVAAKLAIVHLMNRKPAEAVRVLAATRMPQMPNELREQRLFVEARALSETGRHTTALEVMENLRGPEADRLRADVQWAARNWREAGERLEALVGERWKGEEALDASDRHDVLRAALAYTLGSEQLGLARVKEKFANKMGATTEGKVLELLISSEGAAPRTLTEAARALASFDSLGTFIQRYKSRYPEQPLASDPVPTSSLFKTQRLSRQ
jgi:tetratricopeptide (TPR) repeat protein